jgi:hypothetical protein
MPLVGHLDPEFVAMMDETQDLLRYVFQTTNRMTLAVSGTGSAGMETVVVNPRADARRWGPAPSIASGKDSMGPGWEASGRRTLWRLLVVLATR